MLYRTLRNILMAVFSAVTIIGCAGRGEYTIDGVIYGGGNFEGETIYLVPFADAQGGRIDSAVIHDSRFQFSGFVTEPEISILRMRPMMKLFVDELIIVKEAGHIRTTLNKHSEAKGTPLNDSLQVWRNYSSRVKTQIDDLNKQMRKVRLHTSSKELAGIMQDQVDSLRAEFSRYSNAMAQRNSNVFGDFLNTYAK